MKCRFRIENLDCPGCAAGMEDKMLDIPGVSAAWINMDNGVLTIEGDGDIAIQALRDAASSVEPGATISPMESGKEHGGHSHGEGDDVRREIAFLLVAAAAFAFALFEGGRISWLIAYALAAWPVLIAAGKTLFTRNFLNEFFLMSFASLAAIAIGKFPEAASVMLFYRSGEFLQELAAGKSRRSIRALAEGKPATARVRRGNSDEIVAPEQIRKGDIVTVRPGEKIPVDGVVIEGNSTMDASALTGESMPVPASAGSAVFGGTLNIGGTLIVESSGTYEDSSVARVMDMVENAIARKSKTERFITAFARYYTPAVVGVAALTAAVPPMMSMGSFQDWFYRALVLLVISCPCALVISVPLGYFGGIGSSSRHGILVKGGYILDAARGVSRIFFDKTGTLTKGVFAVAGANPADGVSSGELERAAAIAESISNHPVARSITAAYSALVPDGVSASGEEEAGMGVSASFTDEGRGTTVLAGNEKLMEAHGIATAEPAQSGTAVHVASDGRYLGNVVVSDMIRPDSKRAIDEIRASGINEIYMLTGDGKNVAESVSSELGLSGYRAGLLPDGKVCAISELSGGDLESCLFVGDGINDGPALASVGIGVAMGGLGSEIAIEAADVVILDDSPARIADLLRISRFTRKIVWQNIVASMGVKLAFMALGLVGVAGLWEAIFADVGVAVLAVLNSSRVFRI
ncbi:MAG: heavy metal translocating P-type ATPase [Synergistaceae bacterium]|jgi:Cd2+/Zn2+-exporting ATPase|nr:heavy metal translocating P-type ATPase [Synergistaceae bacterium]